MTIDIKPLLPASGVLAVLMMTLNPALAGAEMAVEPGSLCREAMAIEDLAKEADRSDLLGVDAWESEFQKAMSAEHAKNSGFAESANSFQHYQLAYVIDGFAAMLEATGKADYLDGALVYIDKVMASAVPSSTLSESRYRDDFKGWGAFEHPTDPKIKGDEYPLFESYLWRYITRLLRVMQDQAVIQDDPTYQVAYNDILAFIETHIFDKWYARGQDNIYRSNTHMASHWAYIALGISQLTEDEQRRQQALAIVERINQSLRDNMTHHPDVAGGYFWDHRWDSASRPGQDVAHGNGVVAYVVEAAEAGAGWDLDDMHALSLTLRDGIWQMNGGRARYAAFVDGSGAGNGWFNDGFIKLGRISPDIQQRFENHAVGRGTQFFGNAALNAKWMDVACE